MKRGLSIFLGMMIALLLAAQVAVAEDQDSQVIQAKVDQVLKNQEEIMRRLDVLTGEVEIVKVRCSR